MLRSLSSRVRAVAAAGVAGAAAATLASSASALAAEKGVVSDVPILAFLGKVFGGADAPLAAPEAVAESLAK